MTYIFSNGDVADGSQVNDNFNKLNKLTNEKAINDVSATNSGVLAGSSQVLIDKFLDADGQNNTVDTGSTTAAFNINRYICGFIGSASNQNAEATQGSSGSTTESVGYLITVNSQCVLVSITKHASVTATRAILRNNVGTILGTATFSGNVATFSEIFVLFPGNNYFVEADSSGSSYTYRWDDSPSYPYNNTFINFTQYSSSGVAGGTPAASNIVSVSAKDGIYRNTIVQSVATTIPIGMTKVFVTPLMYEALATGDSITADVSIDNGSNYTENVPINEWTPITSANGTQLIVKANLLTNDGTTTPKVSGWRVLLE